MEPQLEQIRDAQRQSWDNFSEGWRKWDSLTMDFLKPMGDDIVRLLSPAGSQVILDIASGTGEPGLSMAVLLDGGSVVCSDISEGMLAIARDKARARNITNFETRACDVSELPFANDSFDAIGCRFGFMFFPDMALAAKEMYRVLKPGGKMAASVWGAPERNFWVTAIMGTIAEHMELPPSPPGAPGMFRCAKAGLVAGILAEAGFRDVAEHEVCGKLRSGTAERYWEMMTEIGAPIVAALGKADEPTKQKIKADVTDRLHRHCGQNVEIDSCAIMVSGVK